MDQEQKIREQQLQFALKELEEDLFHAGVCADQAQKMYVSELMYQARRKVQEAQRSLEADKKEQKNG